MDELSALRKTIYDIDMKRTKLLRSLIGTLPLIAAQVYERYKTCGNKNCKCKKGDLHGPFLWIYQKKKGHKIISTTVAKDKHREAKEMAERYRILLMKRENLRELDQEVNVCLNNMEKLLEKEVSDYVTKRNPGRPKKD